MLIGSDAIETICSNEHQREMAVNGVLSWGSTAGKRVDVKRFGDLTCSGCSTGYHGICFVVEETKEENSAGVETHAATENF